mmetsp:Transcript_20406/g.37139  ORF Transcript_20406/g.37139 Transcript_20406/m.37139 type:complete len:226 (-) Transcript_20406:479-1156(-)
MGATRLCTLAAVSFVPRRSKQRCCSRGKAPKVVDSCETSFSPSLRAPASTGWLVNFSLSCVRLCRVAMASQSCTIPFWPRLPSTSASSAVEALAGLLLSSLPAAISKFKTKALSLVNAFLRSVDASARAANSPAAAVKDRSSSMCSKDFIQDKPVASVPIARLPTPVPLMCKRSCWSLLMFDNPLAKACKPWSANEVELKSNRSSLRVGRSSNTVAMAAAPKSPM